jgi:hypothetical protein
VDWLNLQNAKGGHEFNKDDWLFLGGEIKDALVSHSG